MSGRHTVDTITSDALDQLYARAEKAERAANLLADSHRRAERAEAAVERVRALHHEDDYGACHVCETRSIPLTWPCPTIRALNEQQQPTA